MVIIQYHNIHQGTMILPSTLAPQYSTVQVCFFLYLWFIHFPKTLSHFNQPTWCTHTHTLWEWTSGSLLVFSGPAGISRWDWCHHVNWCGRQTEGEISQASQNSRHPLYSGKCVCVCLCVLLHVSVPTLPRNGFMDTRLVFLSHSYVYTHTNTNPHVQNCTCSRKSSANQGESCDWEWWHRSVGVILVVCLGSVGGFNLLSQVSWAT